MLLQVTDVILAQEPMATATSYWQVSTSQVKLVTVMSPSTAAMTSTFWLLP